MLRIALVSLALIVWTGATHAAPSTCYGVELAAAWKQGYDSFARGDYDTAQDVLLPLAENGFAPAQWLVGRMAADGLGTQKDDIAALVWLKLAGLGQIKQARPYASKIESSLGMDGFETVRRRQESWRAKRTASCQDAGPIPTRLGDDGSTKKSPQQLMRWWNDFIADAIDRRPEAIPYLLTLPQVGFVSGLATASIVRYNGQPILLVNESLAERTMPEALEAVLPAAREVINEIALAAVITAPVESYKGRTLRGFAAGDNQAFLTLMHRAIDMSVKLPPALRQKAERISEIRYEPAFVHGASAADSMAGLFVEDNSIRGGGYVAFKDNPAMSSPANALIILLAGATFAAHPGQGDNHARQCTMIKDALQAARALDMGASIEDHFSRAIGRENCAH